MSGRVQFPVDDEVVRFLEDQGINPNELARSLFEEEVRRMRTEDRMNRLRSLDLELPRSAADVIREDRDSR